MRRLDSVRQDARYGLRGLRRTPLASAIMVVSVALGIGVATAVFTLTDAMLLRPLPYLASSWGSWPRSASSRR